MFTFAIVNYWGEQHLFTASWQCQYFIDNLSDRLRSQIYLMFGAARCADSRVHQSEIVVNFSDGADC